MRYKDGPSAEDTPLLLGASSLRVTHYLSVLSSLGSLEQLGERRKANECAAAVSLALNF